MEIHEYRDFKLTQEQHNERRRLHRSSVRWSRTACTLALLLVASAAFAPLLSGALTVALLVGFGLGAVSAWVRWLSVSQESTRTNAHNEEKLREAMRERLPEDILDWPSWTLGSAYPILNVVARKAFTQAIPGISDRQVKIALQRVPASGTVRDYTKVAGEVFTTNSTLRRSQGSWSQEVHASLASDLDRMRADTDRMRADAHRVMQDAKEHYDEFRRESGYTSTQSTWGVWGFPTRTQSSSVTFQRPVVRSSYFDVPTVPHHENKPRVPVPGNDARWQDEPTAPQKQPEANVAASRVELNARHQALSVEYGAYLTDPVAVLRNPVLNDVGDPLTGEFVESYAALTALGEDGDLARYEHLLTKAWKDWRRAKANAAKVGLSSFERGERKKVQRAQHLLALALDPGATEAERASAYKQVKALVDTLVTLPAQAVESIESSLRGEIGGARERGLET